MLPTLEFFNEFVLKLDQVLTHLLLLYQLLKNPEDIHLLFGLRLNLKVVPKSIAKYPLDSLPSYSLGVDFAQFVDQHCILGIGLRFS